MAEFRKNDDTALLAGVEAVRQGRARLGLDGMVGDLEAVVISTEPARFTAAVDQLLATTGHGVSAAYATPLHDVCVLSLPGSADLIVQSRKGGTNPFAQANRGAKSGPWPNTRLETFVFSCTDVKAYLKIQRGRGITFLQDKAYKAPGYRYCQTMPSRFTGNAIGLIEWRDRKAGYAPEGCAALDAAFAKPDRPYLAKIGRLDHVATRVRAEERDAAILEFMGLTNHDFAFAVYVETLNSITSVARRSPTDYAQVFTSGIESFKTPETSGPTELFIHNYGTRSHHMAFETCDIAAVVESLRADGLGFLSELAGSRQEGLEQIFSRMSQETLLVNEYIQRYDGFDGFFTKSNVTVLTDSTRNQ